MREFEIGIALGRIAGLRNHGEGPRVLALHGWLDNAASFVPLAAHLRGIDLVAIDQPGHGQSAHLPPGTDYSFVGALNAVLDVADALGWDRFALLGHSMGAGMREAVLAHRGLKDKRLRVFPDVDSAVRTRQYASRVPGSGLDEASVRLLVERGLREVDAGDGTIGYEWSSDPRLTLPTMTRMTEPQVEDLVAGIECPVRAIFADPAQSYLPDALRRRRVALLPQGELVVIAGGHHLHMQQAAEVAAAIGDFFTA